MVIEIGTNLLMAVCVFIVCWVISKIIVAGIISQ